MTHWKLVPVEPENEMINAALCAVEDQQGKHLEDLLADAYTAMLNAAPAPDVQPVAWLFQNEETGLTECVDVQQVEWGFEKNNPRWQKIAPLYTQTVSGSQTENLSRGKSCKPKISSYTGLFNKERK